MAKLSDIIADLDRLLDPDDFADYGPNGLQIPGSEEVTTIVTGVSAQAELFDAAIARGAQLVVVHHGLLWDAAPRHISRMLAARLRLLLAHDIGLAAYHLPLDAHPEIGNNALIADGLGCAQREPFGRHGGRTIGVTMDIYIPDPPNSWLDEEVRGGDLFTRLQRLILPASGFICLRSACGLPRVSPRPAGEHVMSLIPPPVHASGRSMHWRRS